ncbi:MAG: DUF2142 domain-containing protein [Desulfuromonadales bacterium]
MFSDARSPVGAPRQEKRRFFRWKTSLGAGHAAGLAHCIAIFLLLFLWFAAWAVIKPPFQAPDEFSHAVKAYSVADNPWLTPKPHVSIPSRLHNPLLSAEVLHAIPFHNARSLSDNDIAFLKGLQWPMGEGATQTFTSAYNYPYAYYQAVFAFGQGLSLLTDATPYDSLYLYRFASAFLASFAWLLVFFSLPAKLPHRISIFLFLVLNPMLAFMSSSINPDGLFYPLTCLVVVLFYRLSISGDGKGQAAWAALTTAPLVKSVGLVLFPAIALFSTGLWLARKKMRLLRALAVAGAALTASFLAFYLWAPAPDELAYSGKGVDASLWHYLLANKYAALGESFWGVLGWFDYTLASPYYWAFIPLLGINAVCVLLEQKRWRSHGLTWYAAGFSLIFAAGLFAIEFLLLPRYGYVLQGRYFLPAALGLAMLLVHRHAWARNALLVYLGVFSLLLYGETVDRYYDANWERAWRGFPFTATCSAPSGPALSVAAGLPARAIEIRLVREEI